MKINLMTRNPFKIATAEYALKAYDVEIVPLDLDIPEIQAETNVQISRHGAMVATKMIGEPVAREDHGFVLDAFPGWPGPYMFYCERSLPAKDVLRLLDGKVRTAYFDIPLAYAKPDGSVWDFEFKVPCTIAQELRSGESDFGWDSIIKIDEQDSTLSEYPQSERYEFFQANYLALIKKLGL